MKKIVKYNKDIKKSCELPCFEIDIPIYKCKLQILNKKNSAKLEKDWGNGGYGMGVYDFLKEDNSLLIYISEYSLPNMVHELHHVTDMIMEYIGHEREGADEPSAYLIGYLMREVLKIERFLK